MPVEYDLSPTRRRRQTCRRWRSFPDRKSVSDRIDPIAGIAEVRVLFDVNKFAVVTRGRRPANVACGDAVDQSALRIVCRIQAACVGAWQINIPSRMVNQQVVSER